MVKTSKAMVFISILIVAVGVWARFDFLSQQFSHIDDLIAVQAFVKQESTPVTFMSLFRFADKVSESATYAPLQYLSFPLLVKAGMPYRDLLFWARMPACVIGALGLLLFAFLMLRMGYLKNVSGIFAVSAFALSLEAIIYGKQTLPYSGTLLAVTALFLALRWVVQKDFSRASLLWFVALCCLGTHQAYQMLIVGVIAITTLFVTEWLQKPNLRYKPLLLKYSGYSALYLLSIQPLYTNYIERFKNNGSFGWGNYLAFFPKFESAGQALVGIVPYFATRFFLIIKSNLAFMSFESVASDLWAGLICTLILLGLWKSLRSTEAQEKILGVFSVLIILAWMLLNILKVMPLSPTRHTLFLLPILSLQIAFGSAFVIRKISFSQSLFVAVLISQFGLFASHYGEFKTSRQDLFEEDQLRQLVQDNQAAWVVGYMWTLNHEIIFRPGRQIAGDPKTALMNSAEEVDQLDPVFAAGKPFLLISHRIPLKEAPRILARIQKENWQITPLQEVHSTVEMDLSQTQTFNGTNGLYLYLVKK